MSSQVTVAVLEPGYADYAVERAVLAPFSATVEAVPENREASAALAALDPVALLVRERPVGAAELDACRNLRVVVRYGVGVDNVDLNAARDRGVQVANVPDYGAEHEVSDHAVALYLAVARRVVSRDAEVRRGVWGVGQRQRIFGHLGATLGLIGFGRIARAACRKFRALGFERVLAHDPHIDQSVLGAEGAEAADVDRICREADLISLHAPYSPETRRVLDRRRIEMMKPSSVLVNVSRGGLVDETALAEALRSERLFGAGLDVFEQEPVTPEHPLLLTPNTVLSDHAAWYSERSVAQLQERAALEIRRVLTGEPPLNWVNR